MRKKVPIIILIISSPLLFLIIYNLGIAGISNNIQIKESQKTFENFLNKFQEFSVNKKSNIRFGPLGGSGDYCEMRQLYKIIPIISSEEVLEKLEKTREKVFKQSFKMDYKVVLVENDEIYFYNKDDSEISKITEDNSYIGPGDGSGSDIRYNSHVWNYIDIRNFAKEHGNGLFLVHSNQFGFNQDDLRCY